MTDRPIALVTGASSGLGECFARALAASGHDLVLVARTGPALEKLAGQLEQDSGASSEVLVADLADAGQLGAVAGRIADGAPLATVINNAGFGHYGAFADLPLAGEVGQVAVNVLALVTLSHAALGAMVPRRTGKLLNVSSIGAFAPAPGGATYSATKAFVLSFTEALHDEVAPAGVHVTALCPGFTRTDFQQRAGVKTSGLPSVVWSDAAAVVAAGLAALDRNQAVCVPGVLNKVVAVSPRLGPRGLTRRISAGVMRRLEAPQAPAPG
ncbi:MAG TPA: SDR family oxidoreductase [Acidimicrobiales bacterium]|nr:SDR family oxidoreductase [Acidimicrobiales bacterium]